jgi:uncharacterized protein (DUF2249 family)
MQIKAGLVRVFQNRCTAYTSSNGRTVIAMNTTAPAATLDVRSIAPRERHPRIFSTFRALDLGAALELVNDHDPAPLRAQFEMQAPGQFGWTYLDRGPDLWRVRITRQGAAPVGNGDCCGGCSCA